MKSFAYVNLAIDDRRISNVGGCNRVRADVVQSGEDSSHGLSDGFDIGFGDAFKRTSGCPVVAKGLEVEGIVKPALGAEK